jgi:hypothetical protein
MFQFKAARLQIRSYFHDNFENVLKNTILSSEQQKLLTQSCSIHVNYQIIKGQNMNK